VPRITRDEGNLSALQIEPFNNVRAPLQEIHRAGKALGGRVVDVRLLDPLLPNEQVKPLADVPL